MAARITFVSNPARLDRAPESLALWPRGLRSDRPATSASGPDRAPLTQRLEVLGAAALAPIAHRDLRPPRALAPRRAAETQAEA